MQQNPEQTLKIAAAETGLSVDDAKYMYSWYDFNPAITESDMADLAATQAFLIESGMLTAATDINAMVNDMSR